MSKSTFIAACILGATAIWFAASSASVADPQARIEFGEGKLSLTPPAGWKKVQPKSRIVEYEFAVNSAAGDGETGRVTIMGAGGSVDDNIKRWIGQFSKPDGSDAKANAKVEKRTISGNEVHLVDISGTYKDSPGGPFAGGKVIERLNYRMLAAIVLTHGAGNYFVKFYGPAKTVAENEQAFHEMLASLQEK
ncbi:MAG: hypothetical protein IT427_08240 [Pirellulales bacterium]|nr:hypothetical protein [Pirellulales bacterium]